jgi:hypothetical protein
VADLVPLRQKLAKCIRLLNSNRDGEVTAALDALKRTLMGGNADLNDLADYVENPQLTEDQMKKVFDAAVVADERPAFRHAAETALAACRRRAPPQQAHAGHHRVAAQRIDES